ncbi:tetratricopeptide repeat protein [Methanocella conradii]|uniref:tetratricopeptide repeat protein n=1 Tax=Methanocella conradii TaxID=1175444 RepID=UPI00130537CE|nr:tetratricopeptide repeat protein [Methanocella conradii]
MKSLRNAQRLDPKNAEVFARLGEVYDEQGKPQDAIRALLRARIFLIISSK